MNDLINTILAKGGVAFAGFMMNIQKPWEKYRLLFMFLLGLIIGWFLLGWGIFPVRWVDAPPSLLEQSWRQTYVTYVAMEYNSSRNIETARARLGYPEYWKAADLQQELASLAESNPRFAEMYQRLATDIAAAPIVAPTAETGTASGGGFPLLTVLGLGLLAILFIGGAFFLLNRLRGGGKEPTEGTGRAGASHPSLAEPTIIEGFEGSPLGSFVTTYVLGDDFFDPSFSIEMGADFLGECGVGLSESIGVGDPKKITAFEVWLFDKSDIRTVTTVLASEYAFNDAALRSKLTAKGEVAMLRPGMTVDLETTALRVRVLVKEVEYAQGNLPANSFLQKASFQMEAWVKQEPSAPTM